MTIVYIILGVVAVIVVWAIALYNGFVRLVNRTDEAWSDIDVQLKRRYDLIPNLVDTVKGYAKHEEGTFSKVTEARSNAMQAEQSGNPAEAAKAENALSGALISKWNHSRQTLLLQYSILPSESSLILRKKLLESR